MFSKTRFSLARFSLTSGYLTQTFEEFVDIQVAMLTNNILDKANIIDIIDIEVPIDTNVRAGISEHCIIEYNITSQTKEQFAMIENVEQRAPPKVEIDHYKTGSDILDINYIIQTIEQSVLGLNIDIVIPILTTIRDDKSHKGQLRIDYRIDTLLGFTYFNSDNVEIQYTQDIEETSVKLHNESRSIQDSSGSFTTSFSRMPFSRHITSGGINLIDKFIDYIVDMNVVEEQKLNIDIKIPILTTVIDKQYYYEQPVLNNIIILSDILHIQNHKDIVDSFDYIISMDFDKIQAKTNIKRFFLRGSQTNEFTLQSSKTDEFYLRGGF